MLARGQIAPDAQNLFETERKRKHTRLTTARIELAKLYIDSERTSDARKLLDAVLDEHPDNEIAKALSARLLENPV
ncbi:MAG: tetratricopeptide repeat protein [Armatimonadota bacterium]